MKMRQLEQQEEEKAKKEADEKSLEYIESYVADLQSTMQAAGISDIQVTYWKHKKYDFDKYFDTDEEEEADYLYYYI